MNYQDTINAERAKMLNDTVKSFLIDLFNVRFIIHVKTENLEDSILIMEESGKAFCRVYKFNDDPTTIYLDWLSVDPEMRNKGLGTTLQEIRESIGKHLGYTKACLWVEIGSWMHEWYKRRGYQDWIKHKSESNAIWMRKSISPDSTKCFIPDIDTTTYM